MCFGILVSSLILDKARWWLETNGSGTCTPVDNSCGVSSRESQDCKVPPPLTRQITLIYRRRYHGDNSWHPICRYGLAASPRSDPTTEEDALCVRCQVLTSQVATQQYHAGRPRSIACSSTARNTLHRFPRVCSNFLLGHDLLPLLWLHSSVQCFPIISNTTARSMYCTVNPC